MLNINKLLGLIHRWTTSARNRPNRCKTTNLISSVKTIRKNVEKIPKRVTPVRHRKTMRTVIIFFCVWIPSLKHVDLEDLGLVVNTEITKILSIVTINISMHTEAVSEVV